MKSGMKYLLYAGLLLLVLVVGMFLGTGSVKMLAIFSDGWALGCVLIGLLIISVVGAGFRTMSDAFYDAWSECQDRQMLPRLRRSREFFRMMNRVSLYLSGLLVAGAVIFILFNPGDKRIIGQGAGFALLSLMYFLLLRVFLFQPLGLAVNRKIISLEEGQDA